jgi:CDP-paratose 2-epimerase
MRFQHILITGGAGFIGANLAIQFKERFSGLRVTAVDSFKRSGSELNLPRLREAGVEFRHTDIRCVEDLDCLDDFDLLIDCAAEPSVHAGVGDSTRYVLNTNLMGTINCLEAARVRNAAFLLLSTRCVYPIAALNELPYEETTTRFRWVFNQDPPGVSERGVAESFPLEGARSFYGASKLACEVLLREYAYNFAMPAIVNRCGVIGGPWQMGKVEQGLVSLWAAHHYFRKPLSYLGFGGSGKQVRDVLHVADLVDLLALQIEAPERWDGGAYNVGGGPEVSVSLRELTELCMSATGQRIEIAPVEETNRLDVRIYLTDNRKVEEAFGWKPTRGVEQIVRDTHAWIDEHAAVLRGVLG